jgi:hypothetical protein
MAIKTKIGNLSGTLKSLSLPITVWEDTGAILSLDDAIAAADAAIPALLFGSLFPTGGTQVNRESRNVYKLSYSYEPPEENTPDEPEPPETGSLKRRGNASTAPKILFRFLAPVGVYDQTGDVTAQYSGLKWAALPTHSASMLESPIGSPTVDPLQETRTLDFYIPDADLQDTYLDIIEGFVEAGAFNAGQFFGQPPATVQLVRYSLNERSKDDWELSLGFGRRLVQTSVPIDDAITIPTLRACDYVYGVTRPKLVPGTDVPQEVARLVVVGQAWPLADFGDLNLPGQ